MGIFVSQKTVSSRWPPLVDFHLSFYCLTVSTCPLSSLLRILVVSIILLIFFYYIIKFFLYNIYWRLRYMYHKTIYHFLFLYLLRKLNIFKSNLNFFWKKLIFKSGFWKLDCKNICLTQVVYFYCFLKCQHFLINSLIWMKS